MPLTQEPGPCPKPPKTRKKKILYNGYKNKPNRFCYVEGCGKRYADRHEVFCGSGNRQTSINNGYQVDACRDHHRELHDNITPWAIAENERLRQLYQKREEARMQELGMSPQEARRFWIQLIGKSYLDLIEE